MGKGAKIAIGCGIAIVVAGIIAVVGIFGAVWWGKKKVEQALGGSFEQLAEQQKKIDTLEARANENPFTRPENGVLQEDRLVRFLAVRKSVYAVYETHKAEIEELSKKKDASLSAGLSAFAWINDARLAKAQGLADQGVSSEEYGYMVEVVYRSFFASEVARSAGTETASEAVEKAKQEGDAALRKAAEDAKAQGVDLGQAQKQWEEAGKGLSEMAESAKALDVPKENIALFRKYEAEIKKYSMGGLEFAGL